MKQNGKLRNRTHIYRQLIFDKDTDVIQWRKDLLFNSGAGILEYTYVKLNFDSNLTPYTKIN